MATILGIVSAGAVSVLNSRPAGRWITFCFLLAMLITIAMPLVLQAAAWEATAGKFGWWTMTQTGVRTNRAGIYGAFSGLIASGWIHGLHGAALVAVATCYGLRTAPRTVIEQARLEMGPVASWWRVQLPLALPWVGAALLATAALAASEMSVVNLYGYRTIADTFYLYNTVEASLVQILWTSALPLVIAALLLLLISFTRRRRAGVQNDWEPINSEPISWWLWVSGLLIVLFSGVLITVVPISGLLIKSGHQVVIEDGVVRGFWSAAASWSHLAEAPRLFAAEYRWTLLIGATTGISALFIAWPLAMIGRQYRSWERAVDITTVLTFAIPGPVIGMAVVNLLQQPVPGFRFLYAQTIGPTVLALMVRAIPIAYWILKAGYRGIGDAVIESAQVDFPLVRRWWHVDRPLLGRHVPLAFLASSLFASGDVAAMLPVIPAGVTTVGTRLFELLHSGARYQEATLAIWYVAAVVVAAIIFWRLLWRKAAR
jgi:iron(III) transport system permease protein